VWNVYFGIKSLSKLRIVHVSTFFYLLNWCDFLYSKCYFYVSKLQGQLCWGQGWDSCSSSAIVPAQLGWLTFCPGPIVLGQMVSRHVDKVGTVALAQGSCPHNWAGPPNAPAQMGEICVWTRLVLAQMLSPQKPLALRRRTSSSGTNMFFLFIRGWAFRLISVCCKAENN